jgi:hypothetical protein
MHLAARKSENRTGGEKVRRKPLFVLRPSHPARRPKSQPLMEINVWRRRQRKQKSRAREGRGLNFRA